VLKPICIIAAINTSATAIAAYHFLGSSKDIAEDMSDESIVRLWICNHPRPVIRITGQIQAEYIP